MTKADGSFQKNHYDAEGLRAEMEENGQLVKFLYNEDREAVAEEESNGNVIRYIRGLGLISSDSEKAKTYYHYVSDEQGSITHVINGEEEESGELPQEDVQSRVLNHYEYDAFGNTIRCEEQVHNRFHYTGEQYDPLTGQYYLRARYYNPVIAGFTQEDTYYGDGLNLYTYCQNNPILYHDPTGHGTKENSPYSRNEQQYIDVGADPDTARLAAQCYPDAKSKQDLYNKYKKQGYSAQDAKKLANREIIHGEEATKKYIKDNNVKKSGPGYTATSPRDNVNTDWRTQERVNAQRNAGAGKGNESGNKSGSSSLQDIANKAAQEYNAKYNPYERAISKGYTDVKKTANGGVSFQGSEYMYYHNGQEARKVIQATGNRNNDFKMANQTMRLLETPDGYVWHHLDDYNVEKNTITMELVMDEAHNASKPHSGGCAQYDSVNGPTYNKKRR
ncbi:RHS repeat-associated core domain-containing protein [Waltera intestinalis]